MIFTLTWKEIREHQSIWLTMVVLTVVLGMGLARIVAADDPMMALAVTALTLQGMAAAYGVVCGAMMFAGEHEGGTLVFLDIFLGRRGLLWFGKFTIGLLLVLTQALTVALALRILTQQPPPWIMSLVGQNAAQPSPNVWFLFLPVVSLEAYAWGLLGSALTRRVLAGAAVAALGVMPVSLVALLAPPIVFFMLQLVIALMVLAISYSTFLAQSREVTLGPTPKPEPSLDSRDQFVRLWEEFEREDEMADDPAVDNAPATLSVAYAAATSARTDGPSTPVATAPKSPQAALPKTQSAASPYEVLWWLTLQQAWLLLWIFAAMSFLLGLTTPFNTQVLWPLATMMLGVACGVAAFAPEQRDFSYQFLAAQHLPLKLIWRFKILFWLGVAMLALLVLVLGHFVSLALVRPRPIDGFRGSLPTLLGPVLFFSVWLVYGFCAGQVIVWLCRKSILALLLSFLVAAAGLSLWFPSLLCGGMSGWQVWAPPLILLLATYCLMRAWAGGRIHERKPMVALLGFGAAALLWTCLGFGFRAWEITDVGQPMDRTAFRAALPGDKDNAAAKAIHKALAQLGEANDPWLAPLAEAARLPVGVLETPRGDGQSSLLLHLPACRKMTAELVRLARVKEPGPAFEHLAQILALSRNLRNKAPLESYLAGIQAEEDALNGLDRWLARGKPTPNLLKQVLEELNRHASETPPPLSCVQTECMRSSGLLTNPSAWTYATPGAVGGVKERWLVNGITLSLETPWEAERKTRIWQLVWAGLFRAVQTPHWELPERTVDLQTEKDATRKILQHWLPAAEGPGAAMTRAEVARLVDASWLADETLFCAVAPLRSAATRARWRVDATRQAIALSLYRLDEGKSAQDLKDLVPKYLPDGLPPDPYSGQPYHYRVAPENQQGIVWSTGPDRIDHGGRRHGGNLPDDDAQWSRGDFDLIKSAPQWP